MNATRGEGRDHSRDLHDKKTIADLHARVICGDHTALDELLGHFIDVLPRRLSRHYRRAATDLLVDACDNALLDYAARPQQYDATFGVPLYNFLYRAAARNLVNLLEADRRRRAREAYYAAQHNNEPTAVDTRQTSIFDIDVTAAARAVVGPGHERDALIAWINGARPPALALALNLSHLPSSEQRREIKRFKDRMTKRLRRALSK